MPDLSDGFVQSTDSDPSLPNIRVWAGEVAEKMKGCELGESTLANNHIDTIAEVNAVVATALEAQNVLGRRVADAVSYTHLTLPTKA